MNSPNTSTTNIIDLNNYPKVDLNYTVLDKELDRTKAKVFIGNNAAFYGALMCSLNFVWAENIQTAQTNGLNISFNPHLFMHMNPETRKTVLVHEIKHVANLHMIRRGNRDPQIWNMACDYVVNAELAVDGYNMEQIPYLLDLAQFPPTLSVEEVYDILIQMPQYQMPQALVDLLEGMGDPHHIINQVVAAQQMAAMAGQGDGQIEQLLKRFLQPKLPWRQLLYAWFNEKANQDYSWKRPNRRYRNIYLPSLQDSDDGLSHLQYYLDVSGSITDIEIIRFNSEFKYVKDTFNPERMTMIHFDWSIRKTLEITEDDEFNEISIIGRGGTNLIPVRERILKDNPVAAIIFTDLEVTPMEPLPSTCRTQILWIVSNTGRIGPFGQTINIRE